MKPLKNISINLGLSCASVVLFLLAIEAVLRITGLQTVAPNPPKIYETHTDPHISYKLKPNLKNEPAYKATVSTDNRGFRVNDEQNIEHKEAVTVVLGDSITFGYGVNDNQTLPAQLNPQFINAGVPGYQLEQQRALYETYTEDIGPEAVILVFYWNDLDGLVPGKLDANGILRGANWQPQDDTRSWLERNSAFYKAFRKVIALKSSKQHQEAERNTPQKDPVTNINLQNYVKDLTAFSKALPSERYFVIWPDNFFHTQTRPVLIDGAKKAGFTVIDLYEVFGNQVETLSWDTVHPSADSIAKAAKFITTKLR